MKAILDGLRYDTDRAEEIAHWSNGHLPSDFHRVDETLYRTRNGRWFLHGEGGALTGYCQRVGDGWTSGQALRPLSKQEAVGWLEEHGKTSALERFFGDEIADA